jgi:hypothetical protein
MSFNVRNPVMILNGMKWALLYEIQWEIKEVEMTYILRNPESHKFQMQ